MAGKLGIQPIIGSVRLEHLAARWSGLERQGLTNGPQAIRLKVLVDLIEDGLDAAEASQAAGSEMTRHAQITRVAEEYATDAKRYGRLALLQYSLALLFAILAAIAAGTVLSFDSSELSEESLLLSRIAVSGLLIAASLPFWLLGGRYRKSSSESRRLELQFRAFEPYLQGFADNADVMRAALAPRLFSRILEDEDPMREPAWPSSSG